VIALAVPIGLTIGLTLGALGGGGSILTVPALVYLLGQTPHEATTTSLIIVGFTALIGTLAHLHAGRVRVAAGLTFGAAGILGSYLGSRLAAAVDPNVLLSAFAVLMVVAATAMLRRRPAPPIDRADEQADDPTRPPGRGTLTSRTGRVRAPGRRAVKVGVTATGVGLLTGFFGVGGGFVILPTLVLVLGFGVSEAVGTSLLVITITSAAALTARLGGGVTLDWPLVTTFTAAAVAGTLVGQRVAARAHPRTLTVAFAWLLVAVAAYVAGRSVPPLLA
jgi:uncharacterized membrane protein YfcA